MYKSSYISPLGDIILTSDGINLTGLWFLGQKDIPKDIDSYQNKDLKIFKDTKNWLDDYFNGKNPSINIPIYFKGTNFEIEVWNILKEIPYGKTITYGDIAYKIIANRGIKSMSSQAVGHAVSKNPISIIVPCHRVIGKNGKLVGYAGGLDRKEKLLKIEGIDI